MPQLSSTDIFIMTANDMFNALKNPHPEVPFTQIGDDTIELITQLAGIFKTIFKKFKLLEFQTHLPRPLKTNSLSNYTTQS
jgi:hypothetical protein